MIELVSKIFEFLPSEVKDNLCFIAIKEQVLRRITDDIEIAVSEDILKNIKGYDISNITPLKGDTKLIFSLNVGEDDLKLNIIKRKQYNIYLDTYVEKNSLYEETLSRIIIDDGITILKLTLATSNEDCYYLDYNTEFYCYNKDYDMVDVPLEDKLKDDDFIAFFNVEKSKVRECRLNFKDNILYINSCKVKSIMKTIDESYMDQGVTFSKVTRAMDMIDTILYGDYDKIYDEDEEELEDEEQNNEDDELDETRIETLENMIFYHIGFEGEFVLSYNLVINIRSYLNSSVPLLFTNGIIIRKLNNEYTMFNMHFEHENLMVISKNIEKSEARELYLSNKDNQEEDGLDEFFGVINQKKRDL